MVWGRRLVESVIRLLAVERGVGIVRLERAVIIVIWVSWIIIEASFFILVEASMTVRRSVVVGAVVS